MKPEPPVAKVADVDAQSREELDHGEQGPGDAASQGHAELGRPRITGSGDGASAPAGTGPAGRGEPTAGPETPTDVAEQPSVNGDDAVAAKRGLTVRLEQLRAFYGQAEQVRGIDLDFHANEVTAIIGPSGCGKSTLVRCINRMHEEIPGARAEGKVLLEDLDVYDPSVDVVAVRRAVGMVFQKPNPFPTMSVFDNVAAGPRLSSRRRGDLRAKVEAALRGAGLWDEVSERLEEPGAGLSGGQQQRLCIARSLAVDPEVILMDEPCSALDPVATLKIEELIEELKQRVTIVIVTHNMQQAARVADRTAFMLDGQLVEVGPTQEVFTNPRDPRTEEYVTGKFG
jgi:phosphate transport system ATP-binding protein